MIFLLPLSVIVLFIRQTNAQCPAIELEPQRFELDSLRVHRFCADLTIDQCTFVHEAIAKCTCICDQKIRENQRNNDDNNTRRPTTTRRPSRTSTARPSNDECVKMAQCMVPIVDQAQSNTDFEQEADQLSSNQGKGACSSTRFQEMRDAFKQLQEEKADRLRRLYNCIVRNNDPDEGYFLGAPCSMPSISELARACGGSRQFRFRRQAPEPHKILEDEESLAAFSPVAQCLGDNICRCPEVEYCFQCYQMEAMFSTHINIHDLHKELAVMRLECGMKTRTIP